MRLSAVAFASALSEHPVAAQATGEVAGAVLEAIGDRPDLVVVTASPAARRRPRGHRRDASRPCSIPWPSSGARPSRWSGAGPRSRRPRPSACGPDGSGRCSRVALTAIRLADDELALRRLAGPDRLRARALRRWSPTRSPSRAEEFLAWLAERQPGLPVVGGNASGGRGPGGNRLVLGDRVVDRGRHRRAPRVRGRRRDRWSPRGAGPTDDCSP